MVRTKDLVLVVVILVMLVMAISATVAARLGAQHSSDFVSSGTQSVQEQYAANTPHVGFDRAGHIERLRAELAKGNVIDSSPSVEVSPVPEGQEMEGSLACAAPDSGITIARSWPLADVTLLVSGGSRQVLQRVTIPGVQNASGTLSLAPLVSDAVLLSLPLAPAKSGSPVCPDSEVIGVTVDGSLMFNADATLYRNTGPETLIGYARDGFPIYGAYAGAVDQCGGYDAAKGYRYVVTPGATTFLSCFVGQPQPFLR